MSQGSMFSRATKVSVIVEDEDGFEYRYNFGDGKRTLDVESAVNQQVVPSFFGSSVAAYQHVTGREFTMRIKLF